jgi:hypothetical protein
VEARNKVSALKSPILPETLSYALKLFTKRKTAKFACLSAEILQVDNAIGHQDAISISFFHSAMNTLRTSVARKALPSFKYDLSRNEIITVLSRSFLFAFVLKFELARL